MKILLTLLITLSLFSCNTSNETDKPSKKYHIKFVVFYPRENDTIEATNDEGYYWYSNEGSNHVDSKKSVFNNKVYSNTAPYKIISYEVENLK